MAVAQESEFLAVNQKIRVRIPAVTPPRKRAQGKVVEPSVCKTELPGANALRGSALLQTRSAHCVAAGAAIQAPAPFSGPSSNSKTTQWHCVDRGAIPPWLHHLEGHMCPGMRKAAIRAVRIGERVTR